MGFFGKILEKLGLKKGVEAAKPAAAPAASTIKPMTTNPYQTTTPKATVAAPSAAAKAAAPAAAAPSTAAAAAPAVKAVSEVDVVAHLEQLAKGSGLDWKVSIVDLLKLLEIDSSREARNELATELGCPSDLMKDSAKMNVWLHKEVLKKIAENGGNIPQSLLD
jgi:hypothetical protein